MEDYMLETIRGMRELLPVSHLSDDELMSLYGEWSQETLCAGWISFSQRSAASVYEFITKAPGHLRGRHLRVIYTCHVSDLVKWLPVLTSATGARIISSTVDQVSDEEFFSEVDGKDAFIADTGKGLAAAWIQ